MSLQSHASGHSQCFVSLYMEFFNIHAVCFRRNTFISCKVILLFGTFWSKNII